MWRNYLTVSLRALAKNKTYTFINVFGLTIGLTACLLILLYVKYERSYDGWLADADRTYQLQTFVENDDDRIIRTLWRRVRAQSQPRAVLFVFSVTGIRVHHVLDRRDQSLLQF